MKCYVCKTEITPETETDEHIIINAAGGRLKSKELICARCNTEFGEEIDSELAKQLNNLANLLMIKRQRGEPQPIVGHKEPTGEKYILDRGGKPKHGKPTFLKKTDGSQTTYSLKARSEEELLKMLKGLARKHPTFDPEEA